MNENVLTTCGTGLEADFWFITAHVNLDITLAEVIFVEVEVGYKLCYNYDINGKEVSVPCNSSHFEVYIYPGKYTLEDENVPSYFKQLYNITINTSPTTTLTTTIQTFAFKTHDYSQGVTLALRSRGACGRIVRMKMYYYYCEETFNKGIKFERTPSPAEGFKNVTGNCSDNSMSFNSAKSANRYCYFNGTWGKLEDDDLECLCVQGYATNKTDGTCSSELH